MNYYAVTLVLLLAYLWHAGSISHELAAIKKMLTFIYEAIEDRFDAIVYDMAKFRNDTMTYLIRIQNTTKITYNLVMANGNKIDVINQKIDTIINR
ncbi:16 kDa glycoprotein [Pseudoplusia includens SNPV IE]|uniref:GP16 n=2 Tax=Chrysodeixis includens nucleopolyhedrovirus TaxID=1207438 RepID=A0A1C8ZYC7_9ABAC|nr:16 kDa glycoprotein [Pseudoplusia includens SNPV IE]AOL56563.1 GP16 [Chrysodeixis includens nucleopolyhedrovirus]AJD80816.1 16 kDa glycoprotein [Pseudoplusia includens SNPV IE]AOL56704.1 GP16 [Chrysodeixis includens nucleopolyhedrovirus]AOL56846.1 GP16 [Chrysodeixis includens nucleopolyhedrovirus]AOL56988.1 GP16 [Chrysodeixis includens nucleopolyhedrovirus]